MRNRDSLLAPVLGLLVSIIALGFGLLCVIAPRRAILASSRYSMQISEESASSAAARWRFRIIGVVLVLAALFFMAISVSGLLN
jgi:hypothetical protein